MKKYIIPFLILCFIFVSCDSKPVTEDSSTVIFEDLIIQTPYEIETTETGTMIIGENQNIYLVSSQDYTVDPYHNLWEFLDAKEFIEKTDFDKTEIDGETFYYVSVEYEKPDGLKYKCDYAIVIYNNQRYFIEVETLDGSLDLNELSDIIKNIKFIR